MSDLHRSRLMNALGPAGDHKPHEPEVMVAVAMAAIAMAFVLSVAVAVSSITHGVKTAADNLLTISEPATTGHGRGG